MSVKASTEIGMPVVHVFRTFTDVERAPARVAAIRKVEMLTQGGVRPGARWIETRHVLGRVDDAEMEVTAFERNRMYTITHQKAGVRIDTTFRFRPAPGGTKVTVELNFGKGGVPPGLLAPLEWAVKSDVAVVLTRDLADLKYAVEH
jgi:uncharacterized membrane protein